jgi:hypothetical protein
MGKTVRRRIWQLLTGTVAGAALMLSAMSPAAASLATLKPEHVGSTNPGFQSGPCPDNLNGPEDWGWHFVLQGNDTTFNSVSAVFQNEGTVTDFVSDPPGKPKHAYVYTSGPDTLLGATADVTGPDTEFVLSHVCTGTTAGPPGGGPPGGGPPGGGPPVGGPSGGGPSVSSGATSGRSGGSASPAAAVAGQPRLTG